MPKSFYADNTFISLMLRNVPFTPPVQTYVALFTTAPPTPAGGGVEVPTGGTGYGRQPVVFGAPVNGVSANLGDVVFPIAILSWGTVVAFGLYDAASGGNLLYYANLSSSRFVDVNDQVKFPTGQLIANET